MSKGSNRRAPQVSSETISNNWDTIFGKKEEVTLPQEDLYYIRPFIKEFKVADIVALRDGKSLRSGTEAYRQAVVISIEPFVMCSMGADMRWQYTVAKEDFIAIGLASNTTFQKCLKRLNG